MMTRWTSLLLLSLALVACKSKSEPTSTHDYSPFAVQIAGHAAFDVVTFKHVGNQSLPGASFHFEAVAEALAMSFERPNLSAEVVFDPKLTKAESHRACGAEQLYVDFWPVGEGGWGYSLWSGCGESDRFAWEEFSSGGDATAQMLELASRIKTSLERADESGCYVKAC